MSWSDGTRDPLPVGHPERRGRAERGRALSGWALLLAVTVLGRDILTRW